MFGGVRYRGLGRALAWLTALLTLAVWTGGRGKSPQDIEKSSPASGRSLAAEMQALFAAESIPFSAASPVVLLSETKCDLKGNIYLVQSGIAPLPFSQSSGISALPVSKLSTGSKSLVAYSVPSLDGYRGVVRSDFDVSGDGHLYSLLEALDASEKKSQGLPSFFIAKYHDDGSVDSHFKLGDAPERHIQPFRFAMFRDGNVLVTGTAVAEGEPLRPFIAVLDRAGKFVKYVKVSDGAQPVPMTSGDPGPEGKDQAAPSMPAERQASRAERAAGNEAAEHSQNDFAVALSNSSFMVSAPDDNVYLLRGADRSRLNVISSAGEVIRVFEVSAPAPGLTATNMGMAGPENVFISFGRVQGASAGGAGSVGPYNLISVISPQTGEVSAVYRLEGEAEAFNVPGCAASSYNFLFVGDTADHQHLAVTRYVPR
jgi:hypothetical protein